MIYTLRQLYEWSTQREIAPGKWVPARPEPGPWRWRLRAAWEVFRGRADAFTWPSADTEASGRRGYRPTNVGYMPRGDGAGLPVAPKAGSGEAEHG